MLLNLRLISIYNSFHSFHIAFGIGLFLFLIFEVGFIIFYDTPIIYYYNDEFDSNIFIE